LRFPDEERRGHAGLKFNDSRDSGYKGLLLPSLLVEDVFSVLPRNPIIFHTRRCKSWTYPRRRCGDVCPFTRRRWKSGYISIHTHIVHSVREHMSIQRKARQEHHTCIQDHTNVYNQSVKTETVKDQTHVGRQM
jgi:hypothetical protein